LSRRPVEKIGAKAAPESPAHLGGKGEDGSERPVVKCHVLDQPRAVESKHSDSVKPVAQGVQIPFGISALTPRRLMGEPQRVADAASGAQARPHLLAAVDWPGEDAPDSLMMVR
jgi:hypothetical protein